MYRASVNDKQFSIAPVNGGFEVDGSLVDWDVVKVSDNYFHIILNGKSYRAEIVKADLSTKAFEVKVNGKIYPVQVRDKFDQLLEKMGMTQNSSNQMNFIKAPMPGLIIEMKVAAGDPVKAGDPLLILEAMKMENVIKSPGDGTVKNVRIKKGDSVEKNEILIEF